MNIISDEQKDVIETMNVVIKYSYDLFKEDDGFIHKRSFYQKLLEANFHYDPQYIYDVFDSVRGDRDDGQDEILTLEEFTNFYYMINHKNDYRTQQNKTNAISLDEIGIGIGFVIIGITTAGVIYCVNKLK